MNKLQKLFENGIPFIFSIEGHPGGCFRSLGWKLFDEDLQGTWPDSNKYKNFKDAENALWEKAKRFFPDAECFKITKKSNFEKWKDFFNDLPPFMCDRFCEVLAKKFDESGLDAELIPAELGFKEEK